MLDQTLATTSEHVNIKANCVRWSGNAAPNHQARIAGPKLAIQGGEDALVVLIDRDGVAAEPLFRYFGVFPGDAVYLRQHGPHASRRSPPRVSRKYARRFIAEFGRRKRIDFANWYMGAMSDWCQKWAVWAREAMPQTSIHQSSGGWGPVEIGTDYSRQARDMARVKGGLRLTNEADNFADNFSITRMASSAARFYGARLGYEPGGYGSKRGVMARLYNTLTNGGDHLFYYLGNLTANDHAIEAWLRHGPLLDQRARPVIDVAAFYSDTTIKLDDDVLRYRFASAFLTKARALRAELDYDYVSEQMILDGALDRYKALVFLWGHVTEKPVLERIDRWLRAGGTVIYPVQPRGLLMTVDGDTSAARRWQEGDTGRGRAVFYLGDSIPGEPYARFIAGELRRLPQLRPETQAALKLRAPAGVFWSVLESGSLALLNFADEEAAVRLPGGGTVTLAPYAVAVVHAGQWRKR